MSCKAWMNSQRKIKFTENCNKYLKHNKVGIFSIDITTSSNNIVKIPLTHFFFLMKDRKMRKKGNSYKNFELPGEEAKKFI